jgi:hypothetical protein
MWGKSFPKAFTRKLKFIVVVEELYVKRTDRKGPQYLST